MIRRLALRGLAKEERALGESLEYLRHILRTSLPAFLRFGLFTPLAQYRRALPADAYRVGRLVAVQDEDCGTCVQIEVNLALRDGVPAAVIRAVVDRRPEDLPPALTEVYRFALAVVEASGLEDEARERIRALYGEEGLVELALGLAAARVFPVTKRALGYGKSCALVEVRV